MRVLIISQYFWPENFSVNSVVQTLGDKGVEVEVLTGKPNYPQGEIYTGYRSWGCQRETWHHIEINRIPLFARGKGGWHLALNYLSFVVAGLIFAPWVLRRKKYDVVFIYAPSPIFQAIPAILLGWLKNCPVVLWVQDLWPESPAATGHIKNRWVLKLVELVVRFIYSHTDLLLVQSRAFEIPVKNLSSDTPVVYHPNSVDASFSSQPTSEISVVAGLGRGFSVMFAGNIGTAQAVSVIVDAASLLKGYSDINFVVLGDGSSRPWMQAEIERLGLKNLHLPGKFPVESMPGLMRQASALLVTLTNKPIFAATVPNKIQAYMAAGRPIIACLNGEGARLVIEAGAGLAAPAEDSNALAEAILRLYGQTAGELEIMGNNGRKYYEQHFDHDRLTDQLILLLQEVSTNGKSVR